MKLLVFVLISVVGNNGVTVPISRGNGRTYTVSSSSLIHELNDNSPDASDNSYDDPLNSATQNSTFSTASIMNTLIGGSHPMGLEYLGHVRNPGLVADELESASKYLRHQADLGKEHGVNADRSGDVTRVLDSFVVLNNLYESLVRPDGGKGAPVTVTADAILHPWFGVDEERNEMSVTITLVQNWTDPRLNYLKMLVHPDKFDYVTLTSYMSMIDTIIWLPDNIILNEKRCLRNEVAPVRITPLGNVSREQRMSLTVNCAFDNEDFPFDGPVCSVDLSSFSWNANQVTYKWNKQNSILTLPLLESNGFKVRSIRRLERIFSGNRAGLVLEFQLERNLFPFITKLYLPLGCFCVIAISGLMGSVGAEVGAAISYFMFGLMSIFMGISFNGPHFNFGYGRTRLDTYYVLCVLTVLATGIVNLLRLTRPLHESPSESYEMHGDTPKTTRDSWMDSTDNFVNDDEDDRASRIDTLKIFLKRVKNRIGSFCLRVNGSAVMMMLGLFISWNLYYWVASLSW